MDSKSTGLCPRRFESCRLRFTQATLTSSKYWVLMLLQTLAVLVLSQHGSDHIMMLAQCELIFRLLLKMTVGKNPSVNIFLEGLVPTPLIPFFKRWICASAAPPLPKITLWRPGMAQLLPTFQAECNARTVGMSAPFMIRPDTN